ncbi:hypothetical protein HDU76_006774 [Blyttiomyces sp. JEL0837]|nr:hypothetical protein HDU76_006774 [Blyttiomyces sp. JEL0837]
MNNSNHDNNNSASKTTSTAEEESIIIADPETATPEQRDWINRIAVFQPAPVAAVFLRLVPYFNGRFHSEEIIFRESMPRKDFKLVLSRYREFLITIMSHS